MVYEPSNHNWIQPPLQEQTSGRSTSSIKWLELLPTYRRATSLKPGDTWNSSSLSTWLSSPPTTITPRSGNQPQNPNYPPRMWNHKAAAQMRIPSTMDFTHAIMFWKQNNPLQKSRYPKDTYDNNENPESHTPEWPATINSCRGLYTITTTTPAPWISWQLWTSKPNSEVL